MITRNKARQLRAMMVKSAVSLNDTDALTAIELFEAWKPDTAYTADQRIRYDGKLYRVVQAHTSQSDWAPDVTPALYTEVAKPGEIPVWRQPTGAQDAYMKGDKVHYPDADSFVYTSLIDGNIWSPDDYPDGWEKEL